MTNCDLITRYSLNKIKISKASITQNIHLQRSSLEQKLMRDVERLLLVRLRRSSVWHNPISSGSVSSRLSRMSRTLSETRFVRTPAAMLHTPLSPTCSSCNVHHSNRLDQLAPIQRRFHSNRNANFIRHKYSKFYGSIYFCIWTMTPTNNFSSLHNSN